MKNKFKIYIENDSGATAVEYSLIGAGIGLVLFAALQILGGDMAAVFGTLTAAL